MANNQTPQHLGRWGEDIVFSLLSKQGYSVSWGNRYEGQHHDITAINSLTGEIYRIEVKTARKGADGRYKACLSRRRVINQDTCHFVIMALVQDSGLIRYLTIPIADISGINCLNVGTDESTKSGRWLRYTRPALSLIPE